MKIERVITSCHDCRFMQKAQEIGGNTFFAAICNYSAFQEDVKTEPPFLISTSHSGSLFNSFLVIPKNCPLENYKEQPVS